jgi:hypothetical protein
MNLNENISRIKEVMGITEAVINPNTENIINFVDELYFHFDNNGKPIPFDEFVLMGNKYDVDIIKLNDYKDNLPSDNENLSIPSDNDMRQMPMFGYVNPRTNKITIVFSNNVTHFIQQFLFFFKQLLKHEGVHLGQSIRRPSQTTGEYFGNVMDRKKYFENKDEVMAFANTLVNNFMIYKKPETFDDAKRIMKRYLKGGEDRMWLDIKNSVDNKTLKKYLKYIYLYLEQEFED